MSAIVRRRPRVSVLGLVSGVIGGLGILILLQQLGTLFPTRNAAIVGLVLGAALGLIIPMLAARGVVVPPVPPSTVANTIVVNTVPPEPVGELRAPAMGLQGWDEPDPERAPITAIEAGALVELVERRADWALVRHGSEEPVWVDARLVEGLESGE